MKHNKFTRFLAMFMALLMCLSAVDAGIVPVFASDLETEEQVVVEEEAVTEEEAEETAEEAEETEEVEEPAEEEAEEPEEAEEVDETEEAEEAIEEEAEEEDEEVAAQVEVDELTVNVTNGKINGAALFAAILAKYGPFGTTAYYISDSDSADADQMTLTVSAISLSDVDLAAGVHYAYTKALFSNKYTLVCGFTAVETVDVTVSAITLKRLIGTVTIPYAPGGIVNEAALHESLFTAMYDSSNPAMTAEDVVFTFAQDGVEVDIADLAAGTYTVTMTFKGNDEFDPCSASASVKFAESNKVTIVYVEGASITYNMDPDVMKEQLFDKVIDWSKSILPKDLSVDDLIYEYRPSNDLLKLIGIDIGINLNPWYDVAGAKISSAQLIPQMGAGMQEVRIRSNSGILDGVLGYFGSSSVKVNVKKANLKVKVRTASAYADQGAPDDMVTVTPDDPAVGVITVYTGTTSSLGLAVYVDMPTNALADSALVKAVDPIIERIVGISFVDMVKNGITLGQLRKLVNAEDLLKVLDLLGYDSGALGQVLTVLSKLPSITDNVRIAFNTPNRAGIYNVTAIAGSANYNTAIGTGTLTLKMRLSGVKLTWNEKFSGSIKASEIKDHDFGVTVMFNGQPAHLQDNVQFLYTGMTSKFRLYSSSEVPTEPGSYVVTASTLGGSYFGLPITRTFRIVAG